jgi:hypothetical protein
MAYSDEQLSQIISDEEFKERVETSFHADRLARFEALKQRFDELLTTPVPPPPPPPPPPVAPTISSIADVTIKQDEPWEMSFTLLDEDTPLDQLQVTASSSNQALMPDGALTLGGSGADRELNGRPQPGVVGTASITVTVTDGAGIDTTSFMLTVTAAVPPPPPPPPPPPTSPARMGIGLAASGRTVFESGKAIDVRADGTSPYRTIDDARSAILADRTIDRVNVYGRVSSSVQWDVSGASKERPIVIAGMSPDAEISGMWSDKVFRNVALVDVKLSGSRFLQPGENLLIEGCSWTGGSFTLQGERPANPGVKQWMNASWRFNRVFDNFNPGGQQQGMFFYGVADPVIEYNVFDANGWDASQPRSAALPPGGAQVRSHDVYVGMPTGAATVRFNVFSRPASHGIHLRCGGSLSDNLFLRCPISWQFGYNYATDGGKEYGPVAGIVRQNVAIGSDDIPGNNTRGMFGILSHVVGVLVHDNVAISNGTSDSNNLWAWFDKGTFDNIELRNNRGFDWASTEYRFKPSNVIETNNRLQLPMSDLANQSALLAMKQDAFILGLRQVGFASKQAAEKLMSDVSAAIGA